MNEHEQSTPERHEAIRRSAEERVRYILWLAKRLERDIVPAVIAKAGAAELRLLLGEVR